jgi:hypothetical protein
VCISEAVVRRSQNGHKRAYKDGSKISALPAIQLSAYWISLAG